MPQPEEEFLSQFEPGGSDITLVEPDKATLDREAEKYAYDRSLARGVPSPNIAASGDQLFIQKNQANGVPLSVDKGLPILERLALGLRDDQREQARYLIKKFGAGNVRLDTNDNDFIIKQTDPKTGMPSEFLANERGLSTGDFGAVGAHILPLAGSIVSSIGGKKIPVVKQLPKWGQKAADAVMAAAGYEATAGLQDFLVESYDNGTPDIPKIFNERAGNVPKDLAFQFVLNKAARATEVGMDTVLAPLRSFRGPVQDEALAARKVIKDKTGIDLDLTAGESSGWPVLSMMESYVENQPPGTSAMRAFTDKASGKIRNLQQFMFGGVESDQKVGADIMKELQTLRSSAEAGTSQAADELRHSVTDSVLKELGVSSLPETQFLKTDVGNIVRDKIVSLRDSAKAKSDELFGVVKQAQGGTGKVFSGEGLARDAQGILEKLPSPERTVKVESGLLDYMGKPIVNESVEQQPLKPFLPETILNRLNALVANKDSKYSLSDLQQIRRDIYDDIQKSEAVPGAGVHYLAKIGKTLTKSIDEGIAKLPKSDLKVALESANSHYKNEVLKFEEAGIGDLFHQIRDPGFKENTQIIDRLIADPDKYERTLNLIGQNSKEAAALRKTVQDSVLNKSLTDLSGKTIDFKHLQTSLMQLKQDNPALFNDVFGKNWEAIQHYSNVDKAFAGEVDVNGLSNLVNSSNKNVRQGILNLLNANRKEKELYANNIIRQFTSGKLDDKSIDPAEFVNKYVSTGTPDQIRSVMAHLSGSPEKLEQIQRKTIEKLFVAAERNPTARDMTQKAMGDPTIMASGKSVFQQMGDKDNQERLRAAMGNDSFSLLMDYLKYEAARESKKEIAENTGMFTKGKAIGKLLDSLPAISELNAIVKYKVLAKVLVSKPIRDWAAGTRSGPEVEKVAQALVTSGPFIKSVLEDFGKGTTAYRFMNQFRVMNKPSKPNQEPQPKDNSEEQFLDQFK